MSRFIALIDPAEFGLIADYLRSPRTPIDFLVHVKSREMLTSLAEGLDRSSHADTPPWMFPEPIEQGLREGTMLISSRHLLFNSDRVLDATTVPRKAISEVIYAPPFYLVHTPGLFEGTLIQPKERVQEDLAKRVSPKSRVKP